MDSELITARENREPTSMQALSPLEVVDQVRLVQNIMSTVMHEGDHYGMIPGCGPKPTLLKPGAEKLCLTFRLAAQYEVVERDQPNNHREYEVTCTLTHIPTGKIWGQGLGSCSTMEGKYRFRIGSIIDTNKPVPREYWDLRKTEPEKAQELIGGKGFAVKKLKGKSDREEWHIVFMGEKTENDNPADYYNTVLKMAKKRAYVDATLSATAASDIFTQDIEDLVENGVRIAEADVVRNKARADANTRYRELAAQVTDLCKKNNITYDEFSLWLKKTFRGTSTSEMLLENSEKILQLLQVAPNKIKHS